MKKTLLLLSILTWATVYSAGNGNVDWDKIASTMTETDVQIFNDQERLRNASAFERPILKMVLELKDFLRQFSKDFLDQTNNIADQRVTQLNNVAGERIEHASTILGAHVNRLNTITAERVDQLHLVTGEKLNHLNEITAQRLDQANTILGERIEHLSAVTGERVAQLDDVAQRAAQTVGQETRTTIKETIGYTFKGLFCGSLVVAGAMIIYKTLCPPKDQEEKDTNKEKAIKVAAGATCVAAAGALGHYWFK